ncbi:hypothetical protein SOCEGT47_002630 [Sorangium cellulosum]|uniref:DUF4189 domain-containing protein n=1 Tax=Sorangium cellulosum TaxID=56 RepID=A0A4P2PTF5_SORCE|nr:hypothetical protein [Sorangium cellulosum]AUX19810.1 hypothetical protein SOCEGT47_002630 [Sorangium cellulosum]
MIVLLVLGGLFSLGMGALIVLGGVAYVVANATPEHAVVEPVPSGVSTAGGALPAPPRSTNTPLRPDLDAEEAAGADPSIGERAAGDGPAPVGNHGTGETPAPSSAGGRAPASPSEGSSNGGTSSGSATGGVSWWCTASASVRVCGFAGACNYQMVFGNGGGKDRFMASQQAKRACEASARAKGATAVCVVQCSAR